MLGLQIFYQRRRKMLVRLGALLALGLGGLLAVLPRADAHDASRVAAIRMDGAQSLLLSPQPLSGTQFAILYRPTQR